MFNAYYNLFINIVNNPLKSLVVFLSLFAAASSKREENNCNDPSQYKSNPRVTALQVDKFTRAHVAALNRPSGANSFFYHNGEMLSRSNWKPDSKKINFLKENTDEFAYRYATLIGKNSLKFIQENPELAKYYSVMRNIIVENVGAWLNRISAAINALEIQGGTCGDMAALNSLLMKCLSSENVGEIISLKKNNGDAHQLYARNRDLKNSKLKQPHTWGKDAIIMDTWAEENVNQIYTADNLPPTLTQLSWDSWTAERIDFQYAISKLQMPKNLKEIFENFIKKETGGVISEIKIKYSKAYEALLEVIPESDMVCLQP